MRPLEKIRQLLHRDQPVIAETPDKIIARKQALRDVLIQFNNIFSHLDITAEGDSGFRGSWTSDGQVGYVTLTLNQANPQIVDIYIKTCWGREESFNLDTKGALPLTHAGRGWTYQLLLDIATEIL